MMIIWLASYKQPLRTLRPVLHSDVLAAGGRILTQRPGYPGVAERRQPSRGVSGARQPSRDISAAPALSRGGATAADAPSNWAPSHRAPAPAVAIIQITCDGAVSQSRIPIKRLKEESNLNNRDLLQVIQPTSDIQTRLMPRRHCIAVVIGATRGVIFTDRVYLFEAGTQHNTTSPLQYAERLAAHLRQMAFSGGGGADADDGYLEDDVFDASASTAFEFTVLEHLLNSIAARQQKRADYARRVLDATLNKMTTVERDDSRLYALFPLGNTLSHYELVSRGLQDCVRALLEDPRDMREACLSAKVQAAQAVRGHAASHSNRMASSYDPLAAAAATGDDPAGGRHSRPPLGDGGSGFLPHEQEGAAAYLGLNPSPISSHHHVKHVLRGHAHSVSASHHHHHVVAASHHRSSTVFAHEGHRGPMVSVLPAAAVLFRGGSDDDEDTDGRMRAAAEELVPPAAGINAGSRSRASAAEIRHRDDDDDSAANSLHSAHALPLHLNRHTSAFSHHPSSHPSSHDTHHAAAVGVGAADPASAAYPEILRISPDVLSTLELLLESVYHRAAETTMTLVELSRSLRNKQDLVSMQQGNYRNFILSVSLRMSILSVAVAFSTFFTSVYGMNLASGLPADSPLAFVGVTAASACSGLAAFRFVDRLTLKTSPTLKYTRRLQTFQEFLLKLDSKMDAAKSTLAAASASASAGSAGGYGPQDGSSDGGAHAAADSKRGDGETFERLFSNEFGGGGAGDAHRDAHRATTAASLSKADFRAWHKRTTGTELSEDELDLMFELMDADGDGRLRLHEVLGLFQQPPGRGSHYGTRAGGGSQR